LPRTGHSQARIRPRSPWRVRQRRTGPRRIGLLPSGQRQQSNISRRKGPRFRSGSTAKSRVWRSP
jgi:hypothetical protein